MPRQHILTRQLLGRCSGGGLSNHVSEYIASLVSASHPTPSQLLTLARFNLTEFVPPFADAPHVSFGLPTLSKVPPAGGQGVSNGERVACFLPFLGIYVLHAFELRMQDVQPGFDRHNAYSVSSGCAAVCPPCDARCDRPHLAGYRTRSMEG